MVRLGMFRQSTFALPRSGGQAEAGQTYKHYVVLALRSSRQAAKECERGESNPHSLSATGS